MYVGAPVSQAQEMTSQGISSKWTFIRASNGIHGAVQGCMKHFPGCKEEDVMVFQVDSDLASKHECDVRPMKAGGFHIMTKHLPPQYLTVASAPASWTSGGLSNQPAQGSNSGGQHDVGMLFGPCSNVFRQWSGECLTLTPPPDLSDALKDVRRRIAALIGVGLWQISLSCGGAELEGLTLGQALQSSDDISVSVQPAEVYRNSINTAKQSKGLVKIGSTLFPAPQGIDINMMPFVMGDMDSLPDQYHQYWPMIQQCVTPLERGKIGFLTIQESAVAVGNSQRRPGLHLETPGIVMNKGQVVDVRLHWGGGEEGETILGGLYTASTVEKSCKAWNMRINHPEEVVGPLGDAEHLRDLLGDGEFLTKSTLYWMTDCTPHESMPLAEDTMRQYFRLVTSAVSVWYEKHSTCNPLGIVPDPKVTSILTHDKFMDIANVEGRVTRNADQIWDIAQHEWGICTEEDYLQECFEKGELL